MADLPSDPLIGAKDAITEVAEKTLESEEPPETRPYDISFAEYNSKECLINDMSKFASKAALKILRDVGVHFNDETNFLSKTITGVRISGVNKEGDYRDIFKGLKDGYHDRLREIVLDKKSYKSPEENIELRLFFVTIEKPKLFYVVAIRNDAHYDTDKSESKKKSKGTWKS
jgi:hypothetical protein